jgi:hypothetical protein
MDMVQQYERDHGVTRIREWRDAWAEVALALDIAENGGLPCRSSIKQRLKEWMPDDDDSSRTFQAVTKTGRV